MSRAKRRSEVIFDGDCGFCDWCRQRISRLDTCKIFDWHPYQSGRGQAYGIAPEAAAQRIHLVLKNGRVLQGFHAIRRMFLYLPLPWIILFSIIALAHYWWLRTALVIAILFFYSPLMNPIGVAAYDWVARNRRLFPGRTCKIAS
ncbi:MAG TPA: DUF393 domain-containing protein [Bryobacteraceae bacterium]|nr:DUF393 domain-containing protein [Bryobacteraceae bacterium]